MAVATHPAGGYPDTVGSLPLASRRHPLLEKHSFEQIQRNEVVETRPHILHFGGFQIHKEHSQVLRVLNISLTSMRVVIIAPSTQYFQISYDKKGLLAPGMSEDITVTFTPHEWRYYYDTVKVFVGDSAENLVVPIHAYPSANDIVLPRIVDFGKVAVGTTKSKTIPLSCKIPIQFEFEITIVEADPDFEVTPLSGVIPADGSVEVGITFLPKRHRTSRLELKFNIAQFDFEPVLVSVVGSSAPDLAKDELLRQHELGTSIAARQQIQDEMLAKMTTLKAKRPGRKPLDTKMPIHVSDQADRYMDHIGGTVKIPSTLDQTATNFVLNQTAGKRPLKDLMSFINEQRQSMEKRKQKAAASAQLASTRSAIDEDEEDDDDRQAMELRFELTFREIEKYDKDKELKSVIAIGEDLLTDAEIARVQENRRKRQETLTTQRIERDLARVESERSQDAVAVPNSFRPAVQPHWDENRNDMFSVRLQVIDRFVRAGSKSLMRVRAQKNYAKLLEALKAANVSDRESCKSWVDAENKAAAAGGRSVPDVEADVVGDETVTTRFKFGPGFVLPVQIPTARSLISKEDAQEVEVLPLDNFEEFHPVAIQPRLDYKVYEYEKYVAPPPAAYMRPCDDRPRLNAALEELSIRGICGDALDGAEESIEMPASCLLPPQHDPMSLLVPSTECRTFVSYPEFTECDFEYRLAKEVPLIEPLQTEPLLPPDLKSLEYPWLSTWRPLRRLPDPFEHFDPLPCSFVEAGGRLGPKLGGDLGGERLSFLPVGGYARDLPSDTDSDEREDFQMPVPGEELFDEAMQRLKGPLPVSEQWHKERLAEERLEAQCDVAGKVVRTRLAELNKDLDARNKLFLG
mmetsp:Transcript_72733/g.113810  ORF Transcript_72733/g.113810 Transcript_72733/m.113810 type:complete len:859 (-) Transcript_72733:74-2650(-)|eukprot:CAMPEP_0169106772 /NCGR_PEP_ID=MMETSP1015-20121227/24522_1 /TAXON_ID=342587 /ORGANISM="Karlodinium micrum, Strain CCMP2283" /LENGTH=858 /DNA_ID=CAMNT_0009168249 /DNA_START=133 /DNA_END=2709 /DNA_ORIENTATION=+